MLHAIHLLQSDKDKRFAVFVISEQIVNTSDGRLVFVIFGTKWN